MIEFYDTIYPFQEITQQRVTVRVIAKYQGKFVFLKIEGHDEFKERNHIETIGGGIEETETHEEAIKREVLEETGYRCKIGKHLVNILDEYRLLKRKTLSHFYVVELLEEVAPVNYQGIEKQLIKGLVYLDENEVLEIYKNYNPHNIEALIYQRDAYAFNEYLKGCTNE